MFAKHYLAAAGLALGLSLVLPSEAEAHRRWLLPSATVLAGNAETVSVDAAASNGLFTFDHRPMGLDDLTVTGPDGKPVEPKVIGSGAYRSVFDVALTTPGTYRIAVASDGVMGSYEINGERRRWRGTREEMATGIPEGATNVRVSDNSSRTETFVTLGTPDSGALQPVGRGIEMIPVTHPNDLVSGEPAQMKFLIDGKPAEGLELEFVAGGTRYRDDAGIQTLTTDAQGLVTFQAEQPGMYYVEASASSGDTEGQEGSGAAEANPPRRMSYTAVLEFLPL